MSETPSTPETPKPTPPAEAPKGGANGAPEQYPDDHPLVKALAAQKDEIRSLKERTRRLDELEESQKSEAEKAADRLAAAEAEVAAVPTKVAGALKTHLVAIHEISDEDAELYLTATDPDLLLRQVAGLVERSGGQKRNYVPREGNNPRPPADERRAFADFLTGNRGA